MLAIAPGDEERADAIGAALGQRLLGLLDQREAADAGADHHRDAVAVRLVDLEAGVLERDGGAATA